MTTILDQMKSEVQQGSQVQFNNRTNDTRPNLPWREGDKVSFDVVLRNTNPVALKNITGQTIAGPSAQPFINPRPFQVPLLQSGASQKVDRVTCTLINRLPDWLAAEDVATVTLHAEADFSSIPLTDHEEFITQVLVP